MLLLAVTASAYSFIPNVPPLLPQVRGSSLTGHIFLTGPTNLASGNASSVILVEATGVTASAGTTCTLSSSPVNVIGSQSVQVFQDQEEGLPLVLRVHGYFTVISSGPSPAGGGASTVTLTCGPDTGTASFSYLPSITISAPVANHTAGSFITITGTGFPSDASGCGLSSSPAGLINAGNATCNIPLGSGTLSATQFNVNTGAASNNYTVTVTSNSGAISASATFRNWYEWHQGIAAVAVSVFPSGLSSGYTPGPYSPTVPLGYGTVYVFGSGFHNYNPVCTLTPSAGLIFSSNTCTIDSRGFVTGSFVVDSSSTPGSSPFLITVSELVGGIVASTNQKFVVTQRPTLVLHGTTWYDGSAGKTINATIQTNPFSPLDGGSCSFSSNPGSLISSSLCLINPFNGTIALYGADATNSSVSSGARFTVSGFAPGETYTVTITGSHGDSTLPSTYYTSFTVIPAVSASPLQGSPPLPALAGTTISVSGTGYSPTDTNTIACSISGGAGLTVTGTVCTVNPTTGVLSGTFVVGVNSLFAVAGYTLTVTGQPSGDLATISVPGPPPVPVQFFVQPRIKLNPTSGPATTTVAVSGTGFDNGGGAPCVTSTDNVAGTLVGAPFACTDSASGVVSGSFTVSSSVPDATYTIIVDGKTATVDRATASFTKGPVTTTATRPTITLNPTAGARGTVVQVTGGSFNLADVCPGTLSSSPSGLIGSFTCNSMSNGQLAASFTVQNVLPGTYFVTYTGSAGDSATASFTVTGPQIVETLTPNSGPVGTPVTVTGSGFASTDTCATFLVSSSPPGLIAVTSYACNSQGTTGGSLVASFTVNAGSPPAPPGVYIVTVSGGGGAGDTAQALFTVTTSTPTIILSSNVAPAAAIVTIFGSGFNPTDTATCTITPNPPVQAGSSCTMSSGQITSASFAVTGTAGTTYTITVTGSSGDFAKALFTVGATGSSYISIVPPSTRVGATISVSGQLKSTGTTTCSISGTPVSSTQQSCTITNSGPSFTFIGTFIVGNENPGPYAITVTGNGAAPNTVAGTFTLISPIVTLTPFSGGIGITVAISGSGFSSTDTSCSVSSSVLSTGVCTINSSTGIASGSFLVANVAPGAYLVSVTGSSGSVCTSDCAQATFTVLSGPKVTLSPASGTPGRSVTVIGTGFLARDASCSISGTGVGTPACSVVAGSGTPVGSFLISAVAAGSYTITLSGGGGDRAQAVLTVTTSAPTLTFTGSGNGYPGQTIHLVATGLLSTDTGCAVTGTSSPDGSTVVGASSCSISTGTATGTFTVDSLATDEGVGFYTVTVTGNPGADMVAASFTVIPNIALAPVNGVSGTPVAISGAGFASGTFTCTLTSAPSGLFAAAPAPTCQYLLNILPSNGRVAGTFTVKLGAPAGTYVVTATDGLGDVAGATFTVGTPVAQVTISPNAITPPTSSVAVGVSGFGFNGGDTSCTVTISGSGVTLVPPCAMSGGIAGATLSVSSSASGLYLVTITGNLGDFASNYLFVGGVFTISTSTTYTTSTSTSPTSTTSTTATTVISTTLTTTTYSTTGISTQSFFQTTVTTVSGLTTTAVTSLTTTFQTSTATRTTTTTITTSGPILAAQQHVEVASPALPDSLGLLALLLIVVPMLFRRLFT